MQNMLGSKKRLTWSNNAEWVWKMIVDETGEVQQTIYKILWEITASKV